MAITLKQYELDAGINLSNPVFVITNMYSSKIESKEEHLENTHGEEGATSYKLVENDQANLTVSYVVSVFASKEAFNVGKPSLATIADLSGEPLVFDCKDDKYKGLTLRNAAYLHLIGLKQFANAEKVAGIEF